MATGEVRYLILREGPEPVLLARVRWPDVCEAVSAGRPDWLEDVGLFDLPGDPAGEAVTEEQAATIAESWGVLLPVGPAPPGTRPTLIRRMPANWSNLSPAERRAWSLEVLPSTGRRPRRTRAWTWFAWAARRRSPLAGTILAAGGQIEGAGTPPGAAPNSDGWPDGTSTGDAGANGASLTVAATNGATGESPPAGAAAQATIARAIAARPTPTHVETVDGDTARLNAAGASATNGSTTATVDGTADHAANPADDHAADDHAADGDGGDTSAGHLPAVFSRMHQHAGPGRSSPNGSS